MLWKPFCTHRFCMSTCFAFPRPLRLTRHIVAEASRCRFNSHDIPMSFAMLWIPSPSDAVLTAAYSSLSAEDSDTTCCFLVHVLRQCPPLMMTPADTDLRVILSPPQSASEYASSSPLCCQRNQHLALGFPTRCRPILLTRSMSRMVGFAKALHTGIDANLRSGRSCDK